MAANKQEVFVVRHREAAWSLSGQHTSVTDIPLPENRRAVARRLQPILAKSSFSLVSGAPCSLPSRPHPPTLRQQTPT